MFCNKCGNIIDESQKVCPKCGANIKEIDLKEIQEYDKQNQKKLKRELKRLEKIEKRKKRTIKAVMKKTFKVVLSIILILLTITIVAGVGLIYYTNKCPYKNEYNYISLKNYLEKNNFKVLKYNDNKQIEITLSVDVLNSIIRDNIENIEKSLPKSVKIKSFKYNPGDKRIYVNSVYYFIGMPISAKVDLNINKNDLIINMDEVKLGNKNIKVPNFVYKIINKNNFKYIISLDDLKTGYPAVKIKDIQLNEDKPKIIIEIDKNKIADLLKSYKEYFDTSVTAIYFKEKQTDNQGVKFINSILSSNTINENNINIIIDDFFGKQQYMDDILIAFNIKTIGSLFKEYGNFIKNNITEDSILIQKSKLLISKKVEICKKLLTELEDYLVSNNILLLSDYGKLYDLENNKYYTSKMANSEFFYNIKNNEIIVKYKLNSKQYLIVHQDAYEVISNEEVKDKYTIENDGNEAVLLTKNDAEREKILNCIKQYWVTDEKIYVRYLKSDGNYAYAIVSFENNYQDIDGIALQKVYGNWKVIGNNEKYKNLNILYPNFNVKLLPKFSIDDIYIKHITDYYGKQTIIQQLENKKFYRKGQNIKVEFCSYIDSYVYAVLSDGKEYVFKVNNGYLSEVLEKDKAIKTWKLPSLLLLQD